VTSLLGPSARGRSHESRSARLPRAERRQQIIEEATRIIGQRGYYGFSMQELADSCGLTVAGLLHHVGSKEALLVSLLQARDQRDRDALGEWARLYREEETHHPAIGNAADLLRRIVIRNSTQPELVRLYSMLRAESLYPGHPAYEYFKARDEQVLHGFTRLFNGLNDHPGSMARQLLALMSGLEEQWLHDPGTMDLVQEWDRAMETIATSVTSPRLQPAPRS
jgi:AcrR family transcriptional regulator